MNESKPISIFLFVDALGWKIVSSSHFMEKELPFRAPANMQFGYSSTAIPTILSGCSPEKHGHLGFYFWNPGHSPFRCFKWLAPFARSARSPLNRGRVRGWISRLFKKWKGYTGYFQLYSVPFDRLPYLDYCEKTDMFVKTGLAPCRNLYDMLADSGLRFHISDWRKPEEYNLREAEELVRSGTMDFLFVYTAGFDALLHENVKRPEIVRAKLSWYAERIGALLTALRESGRPYKLTIFSDHGMTPLAGTADLKSAVEDLGLKFGTDYGACYDSTMFRVWFLKPDARTVILRAVNEKTFPGRWLTAEDKTKYGLNFPSAKYGEEIFLMDPGVQIVPSDMGLKPLNGMHGYDPCAEDSIASVLSTAPFDPPKEVSGYFHLMEQEAERLKKA